jgi:diguanylate cyclase (GGDEF)-like protein
MSYAAFPLGAQPGRLKRGFGPRSARRTAVAVVALITFMATMSVIGFLITNSNQGDLNRARLANRDLQTMRVALIDAETGVRGYVLTGKVEYLEPYQWGTTSYLATDPALIAEVDRFAAEQPAGAGDPAPFTRQVAVLRGVWSKAIEQVNNQQMAAAAATLVDLNGRKHMDGLREILGAFLAQRYAYADHTARTISREQSWLLTLDLLGAIATIGALVFAFTQSLGDAARREKAVAENVQARRQIELLFVMTEMLQSALDRDDANEVLRTSALQLMPKLGGALYVFNNSRDRLDLSTTWQAGGEIVRPDHIAPSGCWALKRGKPHRNAAASGALHCMHAPAGRSSLEIPMAARGELYGLLELTAEGADGEHLLTEMQPIASALADAMSLALSSISLREKLRNQALRDPLTGLYNRRFMEEMLERMTHDAERRRAPLCAVMIDLDHFKKLNDQFGHAMGDAVLRQVATVIIAKLRATDIACRYGGEEIALLMPDCSLVQAIAKADQIRQAIAEISADGQLPPVSCSAGAACIPETSSLAADLLAAADSALYVAKQHGRDRVESAPVRAMAPKLVVAE